MADARGDSRAAAEACLANLEVEFDEELGIDTSTGPQLDELSKPPVRRLPSI